SRDPNRAGPRTGIAGDAGQLRNPAQAEQSDVHTKYRIITPMKRILLPSLLLGVVFALASAGPLGAADTTGPRVSRKTLAAMEKSLDGRIQSLWNDTPYLLLGSTRGVYLAGYGAVFTAEVNLVTNPVSLMAPRVTKPEVARIHQEKIQRLAILKKTLREQMISMAASLDTVPDDERIAIVAFIDHY